MEAFIQTATSFYCLFWFESLVWWVNEGLWVQLSVVMRPLPHSFALGHNKSATPALGFPASPAVGFWRKLGGSTPSPLKWPSLWIRRRELPSEWAVKRTQLLHAPHSTCPPSSLTLQNQAHPWDTRLQYCGALQQGWGHRDQEHIIASGLWGLEVT